MPSGGKRAGSGRKPAHRDKQICVRVREEFHRAIKESGYSATAYLDMALREFVDNHDASEIVAPRRETRGGYRRKAFDDTTEAIIK